MVQKEEAFANSINAIGPLPLFVDEGFFPSAVNRYVPGSTRKLPSEEEIDKVFPSFNPLMLNFSFKSTR
jgi:hypothetical protein